MQKTQLSETQRTNSTPVEPSEARKQERNLDLLSSCTNESQAIEILRRLLDGTLLSITSLRQLDNGILLCKFVLL